MRKFAIVALLLLAVPSTSPGQQKAKAGNTPANVTTHRDLAYGPHERQKLDVMVPANSAGKPLIVWIHGGGWQGGSKDGPNPARGLLEQGYVVAAINYRYSRHAPFPAQLHDCKGAIRFLRLNAAKYGNFDTNRVGVIGASAGGHLAALLALTGDKKDLDGDLNPGPSSAVQAAIDWFGPTDFLNYGETGRLPSRGMADGAVDRLVGGPLADKRDVAKLASPITHSRRDGAPILFVHGDKDNLVPLQQSQLLHDDLKKWGADSTLHIVVGGGHGGPGFQTPEIAELTRKFFERTLSKK